MLQPDHGQGFVDSGTSPPVFLQQKAELEHESILHPVHDPFDTSPEQVCEKLAWFLVLLLPILTAVLVSVFVVGCPACCSCCWCSRSADKHKKRGDEEDHLREKGSVTSAGGRGGLPRLSSDGGGASRPQTEAEGEGEQPQEEGGGREDDVDSQCCWMNCAVWTLAALIMVLIEWLCLSYAVSDQHWDHNPRTKVVIITSAGLSKGGEGYLMATKWLREEMIMKVEGMDQSKCSDPSGGCCAKGLHEGKCRDGYRAVWDESPSESCSSLLRDCATRHAGHKAGCYGCYGKPKGWIPYPGAARLRLELHDEEVDVI
eukprot:g5530.t1